MAEIAVVGTERELAASLDTANQRGDAGSRFYRPELDVLRFFAFLMVFFSHVWPPRATAIVSRLGVPWSLIHGFINAGALGVFVFFMLSSYLITELLVREKAKTGTIHIKAYYVRRTLRIWPLYFLFLGMAVVVGRVIPFFRLPGREVAMMLLLSGNWYFAQHGWAISFVSHLWSISVEEQFYLVWPLFLKLGGPRTLRAGCVALVAMSFASMFFLAHRGSPANPAIFVNSFALCCFFALGGMMALWVHGRVPTLALSIRGVLMIFGIVLFTVAAAVCEIHDMAVVSAGRVMAGYLLTCVGCLLVFFAFLGARVPRWGSVLIYLGKISYGLYVFHLLCLIMMGWFEKNVLHHEHWPLSFPFTFLLTVLCAGLSYRFVESPFLRFKERFAFIQSRRT
jgi:peptidoglycan/LPS O-acetylase OafA/YrhL